jgi:hypothetical protein
MPVNWDEIQRVISPIKDYDDLCHRLQVSFSYPFVHQIFNFTMPDLVRYTKKLLGGDAHGRYTGYESTLIKIINELHQAGVQNLVDLKEKVANRKQLEIFVEQSGVSAYDIATVLKYLIYWFIPPEKYLSGLVRTDSKLTIAIKRLGEQGVRTNLQLLQAGITPAGCKSLVDSTGLSEASISELINRADFSRLPWASKATISNIIGAGYGRLSKLSNADPEQLYSDFFQYGKSIGKNLKLGNEIENNYRIAKIVPVIFQKG